jgi:hypothetical protein
VADGPDANAKPDDLVDDIEQVRERLASTIDQLVYRVKPATIASRGVASVKAKFVNPDGSPRFETILPVAGGVVAFVGLVVVIRKLVND